MISKKILKKYLPTKIYDQIDEKKLVVKEYISKKGWYYIDYDCTKSSECDLAVEILELMRNEKFEGELNDAIKKGKIKVS